MRWWTVALVAAGVAALGCGGFGGEAPEADDAAAVDTDAPPPAGDDAVAAVDTAEDTGDVEAPAGEDDDDGDVPAPRAKAKRKARPARPPLDPDKVAPPVAPKKKKAQPAPGPKPEGIEQVADGSWRVARALVDRWQGDPYQLGNVREKEPGWELFGVRVKDGYHLGMRNKDVVVEVNGHKLRTKPQLLSAYLDLKNDRVFDVTFVRAGAVKVHHYEVVD